MYNKQNGFHVHAMTIGECQAHDLPLPSIEATKTIKNKNY
jgi:hypothetical protein